ncbi:MAG: CARDB domain-containing protein, partial [Gammaproteobacteria bacterium]
VVDPADVVAEYSEEDNAAFRGLEVASLPDAAVGAGSLALDPALPAPGQTVSLTVAVANLGEQEIASLRVRAWEGDPAAGGVQVGGDQVLALLPGGAGGEAAFTWVLGGDPGAGLVVVTVDPDAEVREGDESNNTATRTFGVQDDDFFVTAPYFSPDGDGVLDETTLFFELPEPATLRIEVVDSVRDQLARTFAGPQFEGVASGEVTWDGRGETGSLVRDAEYTLRVVDAEDRVRGEARTTLDTDRSSILLALGTPYEYVTNLSCETPYPYLLQVPDSDEWAYFLFLNSSHPVYPKGIFRRRLPRGELETLVPPSWFGNRQPEQLVISPDGSKLAFRLCCSTQLWVGNGDGTGLVQLPLTVNPRFPSESFGDPDILGFGPGNQTLLVASNWGFIAEFALTGPPTPQRYWFIQGSYQPFGFAPDRRRLVVRDDWNDQDLPVVMIDLATAQTTTLTTLASYTHESYLSWSPDGGEVAVSLHDDQQAVAFFDREGNPLRTVPLPTDGPGRFTTPSWRNDRREVVVSGDHPCG